MKIEVIALGDKMPAWVDSTAKEYLRRLPQNFRVDFIELPLKRRGKSDLKACQKQESDAMLAKINPKAYVVALDADGKHFTSEKLAKRVEFLQAEHSHIQLLIGGPEGLSAPCLAKCQERWSLSPLTFPHPLVRVIVAEALYRSWTIITGHPYNK